MSNHLQAVEPGVSLGKDVYDKILNGISTLTLTPGLRITQDHLAEELNVSRQPVGPALLLLERQGFVQPAGRRGRIVAEINADLILDTAQMLASADSYVVSLAARMALHEEIPDGRTEIINLKRDVADIEANEFYRLISEFFLDFHRLRSRNLLKRNAEPYWTGYRRFIYLVDRLGDRKVFGGMHKDIIGIYESVGRGDSNLASRRTRDFHESTAVKFCEILFG